MQLLTTRSKAVPQASIRYISLKRLILTVVREEPHPIDLATKAKDLICHSSAHNLSELSRIEALFAESMSTKETVTEISEYGVGTSDVKATCDALGSRTTIHIQAVKGTTFRFHFPANAGQILALGNRSTKVHLKWASVGLGSLSHQELFALP